MAIAPHPSSSKTFKKKKKLKKIILLLPLWRELPYELVEKIT